MAAKLTELPPHLFSSISLLPLRKHSHRSHFLKPFCSSVRSTKLPKTPSRNTRIHETPPSSIKRWSTTHNGKPSFKKSDPKPKPKSEPQQGRTNTTAIDRIVLRLRNLGLGSDDEDEELLGLGLELGDASAELDREKDFEIGDEKLGDLLKRDWVRPDTILAEDDDEYNDDSDAELLPWERDVSASTNEEENGVGLKKKAVRAPTLADLTIEDDELRRLRRMGMTLRERVNVPKAGITKEVLEKIHDKWRTCELVRLKFHEELATDMRTAHEIVERRTGGLVTWRSGSVMVVYRGANYEGPFSKPLRENTEDNTPFVPNVSSADKSVESTDVKSPILETSNPVMDNRVKKMTDDVIEYNRLLDGLGPRFEDWWGTGVLPVDADLLPPTVPGYKTPFRLLPTGMRSRLTNAEMTDLRKLSKSLPCHFALGRNRNHQGLATAIIKLWEKSLLVKIAVKRGIQNTNNKIMAEELKNLTGGVLLMRNKYFIVMYRGKDFLPPTVEAALAEREQMAKKIQDVEEKSRVITASQSVAHVTEAAQAGTLAEFYEAQARWGIDISSEEREKMKEEAVRAERAKVIRRLEHKLAISQAKKLKAERLLSKIVESWVPVNPSDDQETITDEERAMYRRVGLRMKAYLPLGIRGVFDGVIENMHLHWKHRELVKLISKEKQLSFVEESARLLEYESGGILVAIERVPKGYALIYYRGKNYRRPISLRPRNLLTKAKALKRRVALQRYEALSQHISELEKNIEQTKQEIGESQDTQNTNFWNSEERAQHNLISELTESEDEDSTMYSDFDEDEDDWVDNDDDEDENSQFSSIEEGSEDLRS